jgi:hypothetical protein
MTTVTDIKENRMGTISFTAKFKGMRKRKEFVIYPNPNFDTGIFIQSDSHVGKIINNEVKLSTGKAMVCLGHFQKFQDTIDNINILKTAVQNCRSESYLKIEAHA